MARVSRGSGAGFALAVVPTLLEFDGRLPGGSFAPGKVSDRVRRLALREGIPFADLFAAFKRDDDVRGAFLTGDYHLSEAGHTLVMSGFRPHVLSLSSLHNR